MQQRCRNRFVGSSGSRGELSARRSAAFPNAPGAQTLRLLYSTQVLQSATYVVTHFFRIQINTQKSIKRVERSKISCFHNQSERRAYSAAVLGFDQLEKELMNLATSTWQRFSKQSMMKLFEICKKRKHPRESKKKLPCSCANNLLQLCNELGGSINLSTRMLHQNTANTHLTTVPHIYPQKTETLSHIQTLPENPQHFIQKMKTSKPPFTLQLIKFSVSF